MNGFTPPPPNDERVKAVEEWVEKNMPCLATSIKNVMHMIHASCKYPMLFILIGFEAGRFFQKKFPNANTPQPCDFFKKNSGCHGDNHNCQH